MSHFTHNKSLQSQVNFTDMNHHNKAWIHSQMKWTAGLQRQWTH